MSIQVSDRKAKFMELKPYCTFAKENDFIEVTEWANGEFESHIMLYDFGISEPSVLIQILSPFVFLILQRLLGHVCGGCVQESFAIFEIL